MKMSVKIKEGKVSMRELGVFLQVKRPYMEWMSELVYKHRLAEYLDYNKVKKGFLQVDHLVPIEIAEEIVSEMTCEKAKELKDQFINVQTKKEQKMDVKKKCNGFQDGVGKSPIFEGHQVNVKISDKGEIYFRAKDVAAALGIAYSGQTLVKIPKAWTCMMKVIMESGAKYITYINEAAVYKLAFRSNKEQAERFTDWVASEVLPTIRKTGSYQLKGLDLDRVKDPFQKTTLQSIYNSTLAIEQVKADMKEVEEEISTRIDRLGLDGDTGYRSVLGYQRQNNYSLPRGAHQQIGKVASRLSRERDIEIDTAPCPRWGKVNTYSVDILKEVFTDWFKFTHKQCLV